MPEDFASPRPAVLVVEDDALLLMDAMDLAEEAGLQAYGRRNAAAALAAMRTHADIVALFTDIQMPGAMDGLALAHAVNAEWPNVAIIVTSGHVQLAKTDMPDGSRFFAKPYSPSEIVNVLRGYLAG